MEKIVKKLISFLFSLSIVLNVFATKKIVRTGNKLKLGVSGVTKEEDTLETVQSDLLERLQKRVDEVEDKEEIKKVIDEEIKKTHSQEIAALVKKLLHEKFLHEFEEASKKSLTDLPSELILEIISFDPQSLCKVAQTCRELRNMIFEENESGLKLKKCFIENLILGKLKARSFNVKDITIDEKEDYFCDFINKTKCFIALKNFREIVGKDPVVKVFLDGKASDESPCIVVRRGDIEKIIQRGDVEGLKCLLENEIKVNTIFDEKTFETLLHIAVRQENVDVVMCLLENGANVHAKAIDTSLTGYEERAYKPLHFAIAQGNVEAFSILKEKMGDTWKEPVFKAKDYTLSDNILQLAIVSNNEKMLEAIRRSMGEEELVELVNKKVSNLEIDLPVNGLRFAVEGNCADSVSWLLKNFKERFDLEDALFRVIYEGVCSEIVVKLIDAGVPLEDLSLDDSLDWIYTSNALFYAARQANIKIIRELVRHGKVNVNYQDKDGNTALHFIFTNFAKKDGDGSPVCVNEAKLKKVVRSLIAFGADNSIKNKKGKTALDKYKKLCKAANKDVDYEIVDLLMVKK